jgi:hypothetical protein
MLVARVAAVDEKAISAVGNPLKSNLNEPVVEPVKMMRCTEVCGANCAGMMAKSYNLGRLPSRMASASVGGQIEAKIGDTEQASMVFRIQVRHALGHRDTTSGKVCHTVTKGGIVHVGTGGSTGVGQRHERGGNVRFDHFAQSRNHRIEIPD